MKGIDQHHLREALTCLARLLEYPDHRFEKIQANTKPLLDRMTELACGAPAKGQKEFALTNQILDGETAVSSAVASAGRSFMTFSTAIGSLSLDEREELYTATFDVTPACIAYVSIHLFGEENFKRGEFMAALQGRFAAASFHPNGELPDHLSNLLRFAAGTNEIERRELFEFCLLGPLKKMIAALAPENPYRALLETISKVIEAACPGLAPAPSPLEQMRQHGECSVISAGCGCSAVPAPHQEQPVSIFQS